MIVEARKETGFGADKIAIIVTQALEIDDRKPVSDTTCYNVLARNGLVEAEKRIKAQYKNFEMSRPDELIQAGTTTFKGVPMEDDCSRMGWATSMIAEERVTNAMQLGRCIQINMKA